MTPQIEVKSEARRALRLIQIIAETIREAGRIPSGTLYACLMGVVDIHDYEKALGVLERAGLIQNKAHELIWIEPQELSH